MEIEILLIALGSVVFLVFLYRATSNITKVKGSQVENKIDERKGEYLNQALERVKGQKLSEEQREIIQNHIGLYQWVPNHLIAPWEERTIAFMENFTFCGMEKGLPIEKIELIVASEASLLIVQRPLSDYRHLHRINIWKEVIENHKEARGTATRNEINLSWNYLEKTIGQARDGHNLTLHEFAHLIDFADDGVAQSIPVSSYSEDFKEWQKLVNDEHERLMKAYEGGKNYSIRAYGGYESIKGDKPELFSCGTSAFFERGSRLKRECPKVYQMMQNFYGVDPANWRQRNSC